MEGFKLILNIVKNSRIELVLFRNETDKKYNKTHFIFS